MRCPFGTKLALCVVVLPTRLSIYDGKLQTEVKWLCTFALIFHGVQKLHSLLFLGMTRALGT